MALPPSGKADIGAEGKGKRKLRRKKRRWGGREEKGRFRGEEEKKPGDFVCDF